MGSEDECTKAVDDWHKKSEREAVDDACRGIAEQLRPITDRIEKAKRREGERKMLEYRAQYPNLFFPPSAAELLTFRNTFCNGDMSPDECVKAVDDWDKNHPSFKRRLASCEALG